MKKLLAIALCIGIFTTAKSQMYVQGGVNLANISQTNTNKDLLRNNIFPSLNLGILDRYKLSHKFQIETGLVLDGRGSNANNYLEFQLPNDYIKAKFDPLYLEVPVNLIFHLPLIANKKLFFSIGPYGAMGLIGNSKSETDIYGQTSTSSVAIKFRNIDPTINNQGAYQELQRFDYGVNGGVRYDLGKLLLKANYGYGLENINATQENNAVNYKNKYRTISLSVGVPIDRI